jgi:superfamily II DNA or RNA helicase
MLKYPRQIVYIESGSSVTWIANSELDMIVKAIPSHCILSNTEVPPDDDFTIFMKEMRQYQIDAIQAVSCSKHKAGQIILPCGTGKTRIQLALHVQDMRYRDSIKNEPGIYMIAAPTIALGSELIGFAIDVMMKASVKFDILLLNSSKSDINDYTEKYKGAFNDRVCEFTCTTLGTEISGSVNSAKRNRRHLFIVSTYDSIDRINFIPDGTFVNMCTYDEAHKIVEDDNFEKCSSIRSKIDRNIFFTATPKTKNVTGGMADTSFFGPVVYRKSPREMVKAGEILMPTIHSVLCETDIGSDAIAAHTIMDICAKHEENVNSRRTGRLAPKVLYAASGSDDIIKIYESEKFRTFCEVNNWQVFVFMSRDGGSYYKNFRPSDRQTLLNDLKKIKDADKVILLHIDILTCGIDLPALTGAIIGRDMGQSNLIQTVGRVVRLHPDDRTRLYTNTMTIKCKDQFIKPTADVIIPCHFKDRIENPDRLKNLVKTLYTEYGIAPEDIHTPDEFDTESDDVLESIIEKDITASDKSVNLVHILDEIISETLSEFFGNLTMEQLINCV